MPAVGFGEIDEVRCKFGYGIVFTEFIEAVDMLTQFLKFGKSIIDFSGIIPNIHYHKYEQFEEKEHPSLFDFGYIGYEKGDFHSSKNRQNTEYQILVPMFFVKKKITQKYGGHHHGYSNRESIGGLHVF